MTRQLTIGLDSKATVLCPVIAMANRDGHDIVIDVLKKASAEKSKTVLMREVGLSFLRQNSTQDHSWIWAC